MQRRVSDQILILEALGQVKTEFREAMERGETFLTTGEIMVRLVTLYSLLDPTMIREILVTADTREERNKEAA